MGNKLVVDKNCSSLSDILNYNISDLIGEKSEKMTDETNYHQNLKIWKIVEDENEIVSTSPVIITMIKEEHFLFNSEEAYIILLIYKGNDELYDLSAFPNSIWGIVESSSNMTPRGLKYVFSSSSANSLESLESYVLSKRGFKDSEYKFFLFIWNGKNTSPLVKSTLLMRAFDLDKKLSEPSLLPYLYSGYYLESGKFRKGEFFLLNEVVNNTFENIVDENISNPSTETFLNFHETVYLLQWLYPVKEKKSSSTKTHVCFPKFNEMFLKSSRSYYDCFVNIQKEKSNEYNVKTQEDNLYDNHLIDNGKRSTKSSNNNFKLKFDFPKNDNNPEERPEISFKPINIKKIEIPSLKLGIKHKVLNEEILSQRTKEEERMEIISSKTLNKINKGSFKIDFNKEITDKRDNANEPKKSGEPYPLKEIDRKELLSIFSNVCSEIIDGLLYLSGCNVASSKQLLEEFKITHIINAAADVAQNFFEGGNIKYLHYNIKDHSMENIECLFYEVIYFIEEVKNQGGRVLIHCMQGVSRSVSLIICYLIFTRKYNFEEALNLVIDKRAIAGPNFGFGIQLQYFYKRLYEPPQSFRVFPKIFAVASYQAEQLEKIVCRLMIDNFLTSKSFRSFDKRGIFIVVTYTIIYLWIGGQIKDSMKSIYYTTAKNYITTLQKHEFAPLVVKEIKDGFEGDEFFLLWKEELNKNKQAIFSDIIQDWNVWYKEADFTKKIKEKINIVEENFITRKSFFRYPEYETPETIFDFDDIGDNTFIIGCNINQKDSKYQMFLYKTQNYTIDEEEEQKFINNVKNFFFEGFNKEAIEFLVQTPYDEDEEFISLFM